MNRKKVGVVVGRFQVDKLHDGHKQLIRAAVDENYMTIVAIGVHPCMRTLQRNPLAASTVEHIVSDFLDNIVLEHARQGSGEKVYRIVYVHDLPGQDAKWSRQLDLLIRSTTVLPNSDVTLYASRDSFADYYSGQHLIKRIEPKYAEESATKARKRLGSDETLAKYEKQHAFRIGAIWSSQQRFNNAIPVVDALIYCPKEDVFVLGIKKKDSPRNKYRLIGGFDDRFEDTSMEDVVLREVKEETNLSGSKVTYLGSKAMRDSRYGGQVEFLRTFVFLVEVESTVDLLAGDDLEECFKVDRQEFICGGAEILRPLHKEIITRPDIWANILQTVDNGNNTKYRQLQANALETTPEGDH